MSGWACRRLGRHAGLLFLESVTEQPVGTYICLRWPCSRGLPHFYFARVACVDVDGTTRSSAHTSHTHRRCVTWWTLPRMWPPTRPRTRCRPKTSASSSRAFASNAATTRSSSPASRAAACVIHAPRVRVRNHARPPDRPAPDELALTNTCVYACVRACVRVCVRVYTCCAGPTSSAQRGAARQARRIPGWSSRRPSFPTLSSRRWWRSGWVRGPESSNVDIN